MQHISTINYCSQYTGHSDGYGYFINPQEIFETTIDGADGERSCVAIDDMIQCIFQPLAGIELAELNWEEIRVCVLRLVSFLLIGSQMHGEDPNAENNITDKYSIIRAEVRQHAIDVHCAALKQRKKDGREPIVNVYTRSPNRTQHF